MAFAHDIIATVTRPRFDPSRSRAARSRADQDPASESDPARPLAVSELAARIRDTLQSGLPGNLRVEGELSNLGRRGHWYFSLKDADAVVQCVAWRSQAERFDRTLADGDAVIVRGRIDHWLPGGRTQLYVTAIERAGLGALQAAYERLRRELQDLGWFDERRKRPLPALPRRLAVVTSASGAALQDVRETARRRLPAVGLVLVPVRVQGREAAEEIAAGIRLAESRAAELEVDAIVVTRGGGSLEDLWCFNERVVVEAVHACALPVVAAIGHESDTTLVELAADRRASTPTQAVMLLIPDRAELAQQLEHLSARLDLLVRRHVAGERGRLDLLCARPVLRDPTAVLRQAGVRLDDHRLRLRRATARRIAEAAHGLDRARERLRRAPRRRLEGAGSELDRRRDRLRRASAERVARTGRRLEEIVRLLTVLDPTHLLRRGFSYTMRRDDGTLVRGPADAPPGTALRTQTAAGPIDSVVEGAAAPRRSGSAPPGRARWQAREDEATLFDDEHP